MRLVQRFTAIVCFVMIIGVRVVSAESTQDAVAIIQHPTYQLILFFCTLALASWVVWEMKE